MISNRQLFFNHLAQTTEFPLAIEVEKAEGVYFFDPDGKKYLDLISGIAVSSVGHRHPAVVRAIQEQTEKYLDVMVYGELIKGPQVQLASALSETLPAKLDNVYLVNSGSEAVEGALKLAKRYTGRFEIISCRNAYHGSTHGALSVSGNETFKQAYRPLVPGNRQIRHGVMNDLSEINPNVAAVIIEPVQGEAGVRTATKEYFQDLRKTCSENGVLIICDEIQSGFGRTGKFWAFEHFGIEPDIVVSAKGMGGGMPIGAFISSKEIMHHLTNDPILGHISTFGGHPVSAAASLATLKFIRESGIMETVKSREKQIVSLLKHDRIHEIRSCGLMIAADVGSFEINQKIIHKALEKGLLTDWFLFNDQSIRIAPPLIISEQEIEEACSILNECLDNLD
jgi:acetylornithine/succinyldiaminopimelate/putrescine aminotransferase